MARGLEGLSGNQSRHEGLEGGEMIGGRLVRVTGQGN